MPQLSVNIDHVATLRQARRGKQPDPIAAAEINGRVKPFMADNSPP